MKIILNWQIFEVFTMRVIYTFVAISCMVLFGLYGCSSLEAPPPSKAASIAAPSVRQDSFLAAKILPSSAAPQIQSTADNAPKQPQQQSNTENYKRIYENEFVQVTDSPRSTFSIDVDTASYSNMRRFLNSDTLPPADAIRIEELINYFSYDYPQPQGKHPFSLTTERAVCPWNPLHQLLLIGLQGKTIPKDKLPPANLVFLVDVSGSMSDPNKLPLVQKGLTLLAKELRLQDRVSLVVYAGAAGVVLPPTPGNATQKIIAAINNLEAGGSTSGGAGIQLAYDLAKQSFQPNGNNRVILATDGDFNVGISSEGELVRLIEAKRDEGIFLTVLGFGTGNYQDAQMEQLADKGNGNYAYIDNLREANKVLVKQFSGTLFTIAKDVKLQIEFNPQHIQSYRLIGYENRSLKTEDFQDDKKDAGELGSGHQVTALYELIPAGSQDQTTDRPAVLPLRYQTTQQSVQAKSQEILTLHLRYKQPYATKSVLWSNPITLAPVTLDKASENFLFAAAVTEFGLLLRGSRFIGQGNFKQVLDLAQRGKGQDLQGNRAEFIRLVEQAQLLRKSTTTLGDKSQSCRLELSYFGGANIRSFVPYLRCMDNLLSAYGKTGYVIATPGISDSTGKVLPATDAMLSIAASTMSIKSKSLVILDHDPSNPDLLSIFENGSQVNNQSQLPWSYIRGAISPQPPNIASVITLDMNIVDVRTRQLLPGINSTNTLLDIIPIFIIN